jgi:hypothetical protein
VVQAKIVVVRTLAIVVNAVVIIDAIIAVEAAAISEPATAGMMGEVISRTQAVSGKPAGKTTYSCRTCAADMVTADAAEMVAAEAATDMAAIEAATDMTATEATAAEAAAVTAAATTTACLRVGGEQAAGQQRAGQNHHRSSFHNIILSVSPFRPMPPSTDAGIDGAMKEKWSIKPVLPLNTDSAIGSRVGSIVWKTPS